MFWAGLLVFQQLAWLAAARKVGLGQAHALLLQIGTETPARIRERMSEDAVGVLGGDFERSIDRFEGSDGRFRRRGGLEFFLFLAITDTTDLLLEIRDDLFGRAALLALAGSVARLLRFLLGHGSGWVEGGGEEGRKLPATFQGSGRVGRTLQPELLRMGFQCIDDELDMLGQLDREQVDARLNFRPLDSGGEALLL